MYRQRSVTTVAAELAKRTVDALIARSSVHVKESLLHDTSSCAEFEMKYNHGSVLCCVKTLFCF